MATIEDLPSSVIISSVEITENTPQYQTRSISNITRTYARNIHWISGKLTLTASGANGAKQLRGFLIRTKGVLNTFKLNLGGSFNTEVDGTPKLGAEYDKGSSKIRIIGFSGSIPAGSVFTTLNDSKVYTVTNDITQSKTAEIFPPFREDHFNSEAVDFSDVKITIRLTENNQTISYDEAGAINELTLSWEEAL